jgi:hypothetical protein
MTKRTNRKAGVIHTLVFLQLKTHVINTHFFHLCSKYFSLSSLVSWGFGYVIWLYIMGKLVHYGVSADDNSGMTSWVVAVACKYMENAHFKFYSNYSKPSFDVKDTFLKIGIFGEPAKGKFNTVWD